MEGACGYEAGDEVLEDDAWWGKDRGNGTHAWRPTAAVSFPLLSTGPCALGSSHHALSVCAWNYQQSACGSNAHGSHPLRN